MKCAVFYGKGDIRIETRPIPVPSGHDVLIHVKACGVCGTDVHIFHGDKGAADVTPPVILGHEFAGEVAATGALVTTVVRGDHVCVDPNKYCGSCDACRGGLAHFCSSMTGYGTTTDGGFSEYCLVDESQLYKFSEDVPFEAGAMTEPLACCLHGMDMCSIHPGSQVVILGAGMIGLLMMQLARLSGAARIAVLEPAAEKREQAVALGADFAINPMKGDVMEILRGASFDHIDTVIECVGKTQTIAQAIEIADYKATVMMFGLTAPEDELAIKPFELFRKELTLKTSFINPYTHKRALELISNYRIDVSSMVAEYCGLEKLAEILQDPALRAKGKYIIIPGK